MSSLLLIAVHILINAALLLTASRTMNGVTIPEDPLILIIGGALLWVGESIIKPLLSFVSLPIIAVTFGFFRTIITFIVLGAVIVLLPEIQTQSMTDLFLLTVFISVFGSIAKSLISLTEKL